MSVEIYSKRLGINRCYVIKAGGCIMVDTGPPQSRGAIEEWLRSLPFSPGEIQLIILTHGHADHVGSAMAVKSITGAKIAIHEHEKDIFENGDVVWPSPVTAWGRVARVLLTPLKPIFRFPKGVVDVPIGNDGLSLAEYGIPGTVIHTPGHTPGSISVVLETGDAFVGCMTHNGPPFRLRPDLPIFAEDLPALKESWRTLLELDVEMIYPAHGNSFPREIAGSFV